MILSKLVILSFWLLYKSFLLVSSMQVSLGIVTPTSTYKHLFDINQSTRRRTHCLIVAKELRDTAELTTGDADYEKWCLRSDNAAYPCKRTDSSPFRFLIASSFDEVVGTCVLVCVCEIISRLSPIFCAMMTKLECVDDMFVYNIHVRIHT